MGFFSKLFSFLKKKPGKPFSGTAGASRPSGPSPRIGGGSRRLEAAFERGRRTGEADALRPQREAEDRRKQQELQRLQSDPLYRFLVQSQWVRSPQSSNVAAFRYLMVDQTLEIEYKDGSFYQYLNVTPDEAKSFFRAGSKGTWVWDNLRVRGTKLGHRKEYVMAIGPSEGAVKATDVGKPEGFDERLWEQSERTASEHAERVARESGVEPEAESLPMATVVSGKRQGSARNLPVGQFVAQKGIAAEKIGKFARTKPLGNRGPRS